MSVIFDALQKDANLANSVSQKQAFGSIVVDQAGDKKSFYLAVFLVFFLSCALTYWGVTFVISKPAPASLNTPVASVSARTIIPAQPELTVSTMPVAPAVVVAPAAQEISRVPPVVTLKGYDPTSVMELADNKGSAESDNSVEPQIAAVEIKQVSLPVIPEPKKVVVAQQSVPVIPSQQKAQSKPVVVQQEAEKDIGLLVSQINSAIRQGDYQTAENSLGLLEAATGKDSIIFLKLKGYALLTQNDDNHAQLVYLQLLRQRPDDLDANLNMALLEVRLGMVSRAVDRLSRMSSLYPDSSEVSRYLNTIRARNG